MATLAGPGQAFGRKELEAASASFNGRSSQVWLLSGRACLPASPRDPPRPAVRCGPGTCALCPGVREVVCTPLRVKPLYPPAPRGSRNNALLTFKATRSVGLVFHPPEHWLVEPDLGFITLTPIEESLQYNYFPLCGFDYIVSPPLLPISLWFFLSIFIWRRSFLVGSSLLFLSFLFLKL